MAINPKLDPYWERYINPEKSQASQIKDFIEHEIRRCVTGADEEVGVFRIVKVANGFIVHCASKAGGLMERRVAADASEIGNVITGYLVEKRLGGADGPG